MDNEAGLEHLSRCTTQDVDVLLIVSNGLPVSLQAASRIRELTEKLALRIGEQYLVLNMTSKNALSRRQGSDRRTGARTRRALRVSCGGRSPFGRAALRQLQR